ncbi:MAG TPA: SBBP repeat-containing protein [Casimicrobiaceae bacterium]
MLALLVATAGLVGMRCEYAVAVGVGAERAARTATILGQLPFAFESSGNDDTGPAIRFVARGVGYRVAVAPTDVQLHMSKRLPRIAGGDEGRATRIVDLRFVNGRNNAVAEGVDRLAAPTHYFVGRSGSHRPDVANFARVHFHEVYQGIDIDYYGTNGQLEFDLTLRPGADISAVKLTVAGGALSLDPAGGITIGSGDASVVLHEPTSYQLVAGVRRPVESGFTLSADKEIGFFIGAYDHTKPLIVDPIVTYASYLGGKGLDVGTAIAVDAAGNMYIAGSSGSTDFPLAGAYDRNLAKSDTDVFVTKINAQGTALVYSTYLGGGSGIERATGIAVDKSGNVYVTGNTSGSDFPTTSGAYQSSIAGGGAFVVKLGPSGNTLVYSTYVRSATANAIAVDADGNAYITGSALSGFATTPGVLQSATGNAGGTNAFVLKLNATGTAAMYATFLGGSGNDIGNAVAVDGAGNAHVGGGTTSPNFPSVAALQPASGGARDGFIAKLNSAGSALRFATYLGGTLDDAVNAIAVDGAGNIYAAGETFSGNFPLKDAYQPKKSGTHLLNSSLGNAFFAKITGDGAALVYASFLGGEICTGLCQPVFPTPQFNGDAAYAITVDAYGDAYVGGLARTYQFPLLDSPLPQKTNDNFTSSFVAKVGRGGGLLYSTFVRSGFSIGGTSRNDVPIDSIAAIAVDATGAAYVVGNVDSYSALQPTSAAFQRTFAGFQDATIVKLSGSTALIDLVSSSNPIDIQKPLTLTATISGATLSGIVEFRDGRDVIGTAPITAGKAILTPSLPAGVYVLTAVYIGNGVNVDSPLLYQVIDNPLDCN